MPGPALRPKGVIAALILAVITLTVFYNLRDYGPESAIRRFHEGLAKLIGSNGQDVSGVEAAAEPPQSAANFQLVVQYVRELVARGIPYRIMKMDREPDEVSATAVYGAPGGRQIAIIWVVDKDGPAWKVNIDKTATILRDQLGQ